MCRYIYATRNVAKRKVLTINIKYPPIWGEGGYKIQPPRWVPCMTPRSQHTTYKARVVWVGGLLVVGRSS